jgi:hypothetical protein
METLQNLLTIAAEATVIVGLAGIAVHAIYTQHKNFMTEFCPPVAPYQPEVQAAVAPAAVEAVEVATAEQPEIQEEEVETAVAPAASVQPATEIDLTALDPTTLRKLCTKHQIAWKHARGKNRHATKSMMIHQLSSRLTA